MNIAGIDYSLRGPAICVYAGDFEDSFNFSSCNFYYLTSVKKYCGVWNKNIHGETFYDYNEEPQRYETIADWAIDKLVGCDYIALEGYSFGSSSNRLFQIAENTGLLKYKIYHSGTPLDVIPPSQVKKYATGKGNANKEAMYLSFKDDTFVDLKDLLNVTAKNCGPVYDIVDSYFICKLLHEQLKTQPNGKKK